MPGFPMATCLLNSRRLRFLFPSAEAPSAFNANPSSSTESSEPENDKTQYNTGLNKSLVLEPGTSKISIRTSIYFHPMSDGQVKKL